MQGARPVVTIRVVLADDQALLRKGFRMILEAEDDLTVVGEAGDGTDAVRLVELVRAPMSSSWTCACRHLTA